MTEQNNQITAVVRAFAGAKKEKVIKINENDFEIYVREPAQNNLANKRIKFLLAVEYGVLQKEVQILTGHKSPKKKFVITKP